MGEETESTQRLNSGAGDRRVGILLIHGIGNQSPGDLAGYYAKILARSGSEEENRAPAANDRLTRSVRVADQPVLIREANWSFISSLDNRLDFRDAGYMSRNYLAALGQYAAHRLRRVAAFAAAVPWLALPIYSLVLVFAWGMFQPLTEALSREPEFAQWPGLASIAAGFLALCMVAAFALGTGAGFDRFSRRVDAAGVRPVAGSAAVSTLGLVFLAAYALVALLTVAVVFYAGILLVATLIGVVGRLMAAVFNALSRLFERMSRRGAAVWVRRLGWLFVGLPIYVALSGVKSGGNLISILLSDARAGTKVIAYFFGFTFLSLALLPAMALLATIFSAAAAPLTVVLSGEFDAIAATLAIATLLLAFGFIKVTLPVLDLLLDITHYHLASRSTRYEYQHEVLAGAEALQNAGCNDIYVLAHSLGSVIAVDALQSGRFDGLPITVLHTIGSPLDKFWYADRTHRRTDDDHERLHWRGLRWLNTWAVSDLVSGHLDHFLGPAGAPENRHLADLWNPLVSHVRYWDHPFVVADVCSHVTGKPPPGSAPDD